MEHNCTLKGASHPCHSNIKYFMHDIFLSRQVFNLPGLLDQSPEEEGTNPILWQIRSYRPKNMVRVRSSCLGMSRCHGTGQQGLQWQAEPWSRTVYLDFDFLNTSPPAVPDCWIVGAAFGDRCKASTIKVDGVVAGPWYSIEQLIRD